MWSVFRRLHGWFWSLLAWLIILFAVLLSLLRWQLHNLDLTALEAEIEQQAEQIVGLSADISELHAELQGFHLLLNVSDVRFSDPGSDVVKLHLPLVKAKIYLLRSLLQGRLVLGRGMLFNVSFDIERTRSGQVLVNGFAIDDQGEASGLGVFASHADIHMRDCRISWRDQLTGQPEMIISNADARLQNRRGRHRIQLSGLLNDRSQVAISADLRSNEDQPLAVSGPVHVRVKELPVAMLPIGRVADDLSLNLGEVSLAAWGELYNGEMTQLEGSLDLRQLSISRGEDQFDLKRGYTKFDWQSMFQGWSVDLWETSLVRGSRLWPRGAVSFTARTNEDDLVGFEVGGGYLNLTDLIDLALTLKPFEPELQDALRGLSPTGDIHDYQLAVRFDQQMQWRLLARVQDYSQDYWGNWPGVSGLGLELSADQTSGSMVFSSNELEFEMPGLFRETLKADRFEGALDWRNTEKGTHLNSSGIELANADAKSRSRLYFWLPREGKPELDMQTDFWSGRGSSVHHYLPVGIMDDELVHWLDQALISGQVPSGSLLVHGPLSDFPYLKDQGRFEVLFGVENAILDYREEWPRLEEANADLHFVNNGLDIRLIDGKMLKSNALGGHAHIGALIGTTELALRGSVAGPVSDLFSMMSDSPLRKRLKEIPQVLSGKGRARTSIEVMVPLEGGEPYDLHGIIQLEEAQLSVNDHDLELHEINGVLKISDEMISARKIQARMLDQPVEVDIHSELEGGIAKTSIETDLHVGSDWLKNRVPVYLDTLQGTAKTHVELAVAHQPVPEQVELLITSDLEGMAINMPHPVGKTASEIKPVRVGVSFLAENKSRLSIDYGADIRAQLMDAGQGFRVGDVCFGPGDLNLPDETMINLRGQLGEVDIMPWVSWVTELAQTGGEPVALALNMQAERASISGMHFPDSNIQVKQVPDGWWFMIDSQELKGKIWLPHQHQLAPVVAYLNQFNLKTQDIDQQIIFAADENRAADIDPLELPALDLRVDDFHVNGQPMGKVVLQWQKVPLGLRISRLSVNGANLKLNGDGYWRRNEADHNLTLDLTASVDSLADLQKDLNIESGIEDASMELKAKLAWPESLNKISLAGLRGGVDIKAGPGIISDVDPGAGKLIGLLGVHMLAKRLLLDFSDLSTTGLKFDQITGHLELTDGHAYTPDMTMVGPAVKIEMRGRTGYIDRDYDQDIYVTPRVSATIPLLGALTINPTVGVALALAQQLMGDQVDKISQTHYTLEGSWDEPIMTKVKRKTTEDSGQSEYDFIE